MHRSASPRPGYRPSSRSGSLANSTPLSPRIGIRDRDRSRDSSPALNFLARRGSEANRNSDDENDANDAHDPFVIVDAEEAMANAERDLKADAEWKRIQQNTFTRWANEHLKQADKQIHNLETELSDGLKLISLIEVLSGKRMPKHNKRPNFRSQKLENVSIALQFLEREGVTLVNIDSTDIVDCKLKLILGLIWTLILHYAISMPMWDGPPLGGGHEDKTPKQRLLGWVKDKLPADLPVHNFTSDWNNGKAVGALVDSVAPGLCPDWEDWDPNRPLENAREAMDLADQWLNVPKLLTPEEIVNPNVDEQSMMTYLSQFPNAKLKPGAPLRQKTNPSKVRAYGPGLEPKGLVAKAPAKFTVETFGAGDGEVTVDVVGPNNKVVKCDIIFNNDRKHTYSCSYFPEEEGDYVVTIKFATREIPKSPYKVNVEGFAGDASKVTAAGPGLEPEGVVINKPTYFDIFAEGAGKGNPEVIILDPKGKKDSAPIKITPSNEKKDVYRCEYVATMLGLHSVNVFYAGNPIPDSPFGVKVAPISQPNKVWASGRGLQPNGIRINETVDFKVFTEGAGEGAVGVKIIGPGGKDVHATSRKVDDFITEYTYTPQKEGRHIIMVTFANQEIPRSPFEVNIGAFKTSKIKAYGPGLKGGIVHRPAVFTVDTCGETGSLGFSIEGPSQAKINCKDNGDGSADVEYLPTAIGEYAVHILCDKEDIPGSPYMAQILPSTDFYPEKVKVFGPGVENGVNPKETTYFTVDITEAGEAPLEILIIDDLGQFEPDIKKKSEGIFECSYTTRKGMHKQTIMVNFGGVAVPGSPFHVTNNNPNDPTQVRVYGPGVEKGVRAGVPVEFTVDCKKSGPGDIKVKIESSKRKSVPVSIENNGDDTYTVTYEAKDHGPQTITITLDDEEVPQSPIKLDIKKGVDLSQIKIMDLEPRAFVDCVNDFYIDLSALAPADQKATIECDIKGPSGAPVDTYVSKVGPDGAHQVSYTPTEEGEHEIDVKYDGTSLPDTPYPVNAERGCDPSKVKIFGDGLEKGIVDEVNTFVVETKNAGTGELGIAVEGPSEAEITCHDNKDGTCTVDYIPTEEGDYDVTVKFGDEHIPGSPFKVPVTTKDGKPKADARKVVAYGPGLEPGQVLPGKPAAFTVDSSATGEAPVEVGITSDGKNVSRKPTIVKKGDGIHEVSYVPPPVGDPYEISVKYGGQEIPGSPFAMTSNPDLDDVGYEKNGTGLQRKKLSSSSGQGDDDKDKKHGIRDLIRNAAPGAIGAAARKGSQDVLGSSDDNNNAGNKKDGDRKGSKGGRGGAGDSDDSDGSPYGSGGRNKDGSRKGSRPGYGDDDDSGKLGRGGKPSHGGSGDSSDGEGRGKKKSYPGDAGSDDNDDRKSGPGKDGRKPLFGRRDSDDADKAGKKSSLFGGRGGNKGDDDRPYGRKGSRDDDDSGDDQDGKGGRRGSDDGRPLRRVGSKDEDGKYGRPLYRGDSGTNFGRAGSGDDDKDGKGPKYGRDGQRKGSSGDDGDNDKRRGPNRGPSFDDGSKYGKDGDNDGKYGKGRDGLGKGPYGGGADDDGKYGRGRDSLSKGPYGSNDDEDGRHGDNDGKYGKGRDGLGKGPYGGGADDDGKYGRGRDSLSKGPYGSNDDEDGRHGDNDGKYGKGRDGLGKGPYGGGADDDGKYGRGRDSLSKGPYGSNDDEDGRHGDNDGKYGKGRDGLGKGPHGGGADDDGKYGRGRDGLGKGPYGSGDNDKDGKGPKYGRDGQRKGSSGDDGDTDRRGGPKRGPSFDDGSKYGKDGDNDGKYGKGKDGLGKGPYGRGDDNEEDGKGPYGGNRNDNDGKYGRGPGGRDADGQRRKGSGLGRSSDDGTSSDDDKNRRGSRSGPHGASRGRDSLGGDGKNKASPFGRGGSDGDSGDSPKYGKPGQRRGPSFDDDRQDGKYGKGRKGSGLGGHGSQDGTSSDDDHDGKGPHSGRGGDGRGGNNRGDGGNRRGPSFGRGGENEDDKGIDDNGNKKGFPYKRADSGSLLGRSTLDDNPDEKYGRAKDNERDRRGPLFRRGDSNSLYGDDNDIDGSPYGRKDPYGRDGPLSAGKTPLYGKGLGDDDGPGRKGSSPYDQDGRRGSGAQGGRRGSGGPFKPLELNGIPLPPGAGGRLGAPVEANVKTPSGNLEKANVSDNGNGSLGVSYQPTEAGPHNLDVKYNGDHVQGSPFKFHATPLDEGKVAAYGPGLTHGVCGDPAKFVISTKGAGAGGLSLAVEGPSKAEINCQDNKDGTVDVSYLPTAPGEYKISAKFADKHIDGSPFTCKITGEGTKRNAISVGSSSELSLPENLSDYDLRSLQASILSPSGVEEPCFLKKLPKGNNGISFTPREIGEHQVSVKRNGKHIKNSPFKIMVNPDDVGDASRVKVRGPALGEGKTHKDNVFTVDTKNAGYGGLSLSVEGPSKAEIKCQDNEDGTLDVSYKPTEPGLYIVNLKFADQHVPGSPFAVAVSGEGSEKQTGKIKRMREAVPITEVGSQCRLTFKMPGVNCTDLKANVTSPTGKVEKAVVAEIEDGLYSVNFVPYELGIHTVSVMYREVDIPGSPFQFTVGPLQDGGAHRVHAGGPGLERGIQGQPADFNVWTREAGHGSLAISVEGPSKAEVDFKDRKDGSCHVSYIVEEPGEYSVGIRFNDTHIPGSPYKVYIQPSADEAERVRLSNVADCPVSPDVPQTMLLNMNGADGDVECKIIAPSGREDDCFITPLGDGEHSVRFVPKEEGTHYLHAKLNGIHIPGSPFKLVVGGQTRNSTHDDPSTVGVSGQGIERGVTGEPSTFVIDTSGVGAGTLSITVDGPSKVDLSCNEVEEGYEVRYTPMVPGKYFVTVKYNGKNVKGSPFSVNVGGDNLGGGNSSLRNLHSKEESRTSSMTMETMQRTSYIRHQYSEQRASSVSVSRSSTRPIIPVLGADSDASRVLCRGSGLESALVNRRNSFTVDCAKAGNNCLFVGVYGPETPCEEVVIKHRGSLRYSVDYVVKEKGNYIVFVKWGDEHVPGSPFHINA